MLFTHIDLEEGEKIVHEARKHWYVFIWNILTSLLLLIAPPIIYVVALALLPEKGMLLVTNYFFLALFAYALWCLAIWVILFINWTNYYLDVWFITNKRIIDIEQKGIFHREVSNLRFDRIQDVTVEVRGIIATFFQFGELRIQTASENSKNFVMVNCSRPEEARKLIFEMHNKEVESEKLKDNLAL